MQEQLPRGELLELSLPSPLRGRRCAAFKFAPGEFVELKASHQDLHTPQIRKAPRGGLFVFGGEGGIRTLDNLNIFNMLQRHRVQIVSTGNRRCPAVPCFVGLFTPWED